MYFVDHICADISVGVSGGSGRLGRNILVKGSSFCNIHELHSTADAEDWFSGIHSFLCQKKIRTVNFEIKISASWMRHLVVEDRSDVHAAGHQDSITHFEIIIDLRSCRCRRDDDRKSADPQNRVQIIRINQ